MSANAEAQCAGISEEGTHLSTACQGYVLPEGKIMPNTVFVGGIDIRMNEAEIRSYFEQYGTVKEVKIITDRTGVSKGYGFVSFLDNVDVQKIVEPRPLSFNPPAPQFHSVWNNQNAETYVQPQAVVSPLTQYVQALPQWVPGEQRNYVMPPVYTSANYHYSEEPEFIRMECAAPEPTPLSSSGPQKKSVDRSIQTVVSCLFNPESRLRSTFVSQDDYFRERRVHHFRKGRAVLKSV
ncbi:UNVERIFIED_CONTAM: hypothetical protein H355_011663 [Colinus virginianus]|nr:hypothetical protein H355_011663 [Colinus virginianus]